MTVCVTGIGGAGGEVRVAGIIRRDRVGTAGVVRLVVVKDVIPLLRLPVPSVEVPFKKVTVPVGNPVPGDTAPTVAVNVTDSPDVLGLTLELKAVLVLAWCTTWETADELLAMKFASPT